jgi:hypothetical protein
MDQTILFARSNEIYESKSAAIEKLNTLVKFKYGMPAVVRYNSSDAGDPNVILAVGITTNPEGEIGENAYRIVSDSKQSDVQDSLDKYNSTLEDVTVTENIGGIKKGTSVNDLKGKTITELFDDLLFPTIIPSADTSTAVTLSSSKTGLVEVGTTVSPALTATYNTGFWKLNGSNTSYKYRGNATKYEFFKVGESEAISSGTSNKYTVPEFSAPVGVVQWNVKVTYEAGDAPKDNKGKDHTQNPDVPQAIQAGTATSSNVSIEGTYAVYAGTSTTLNKQPLRSLGAKTTMQLTLPASTVANPQTMRFPTSMNQPTKIMKYNANSGKYDISEPLSMWTITETTVSEVAYKNYKFNGGADGADRGEVKLELSF